MIRRPLTALRERLQRGEFAKSVMVLAGGTAIGQGIAFAASPILTRIFSPAQFGILAVFTALLSSFTPITSLRYQLAIPLPEEEEDAANLLVLSILLVVVTSLVALLAVALRAEWIVRTTNAPQLKPFLWMLPVSLLGAGLYTALSYWAIRRHDFRAIARTKINAMAATVAVQLLGGWWVAGPFALLLGDVIGRISGTGTLCSIAWRTDGVWFRRVRYAGIREVVRRHRRFPLYSTPSSLLNSFGSNLPTLVFAAYFGPGALGLFALSQRMLGAPSTLIGQSVGQVYGAKAAQLVREKPAALYRLFARTSFNLLLIGLLPALLLTLAGPQIFGLVFGAQWRQAGDYSRVLAIMYLVQFVAVPLSATTDVLELQDWQLYWDTARLCLVAGGVYVAGAQRWSAIAAVGVYGGTMCIAYLGYLLMMQRALRRTRPAEILEPVPAGVMTGN